MKRCRRHRGERVSVVRQGDRCLGQRPAATAISFIVINGQSFAKDLSRSCRKHAPARHEIAGRIADSRGREVEDATEPSIRCQHVAGEQITVSPDGSASPRVGVQGTLPEQEKLRDADEIAYL